MSERWGKVLKMAIRERPFGRTTVQSDSFRLLSTKERQVLGLIRANAPVSRAELARRTGLALPTVSRLCDQLLRDGLIVADAKTMMSSRGQPSVPLLLARDAAYAFGVTVRADQLSICLIDLDGRLVGQREEAINGAAREVVTGRIVALTAVLAQETGVAPQRVAGLGLALSGFFVNDPVRINAPLGMEDWVTSDLETALVGALGVPILIENDGSAAAIGERLYGLGQQQANFAYLYVDRGLGGGLVIHGQLIRGRNGNAGEITGMIPPTLRDARPTLSLLLEMARQDGMPFSSISEMLGSLDPASPCVDRWIDTVVPVTEMVISAIAALVDPDIIVLGGRLPTNIAKRLIGSTIFYTIPVRKVDRAFPTFVPSTVVGDAAALGAAALVFDHHFL